MRYAGRLWSARRRSTRPFPEARSYSMTLSMMVLSVRSREKALSTGSMGKRARGPSRKGQCHPRLGQSLFQFFPLLLTQREAFPAREAAHRQSPKAHDLAKDSPPVIGQIASHDLRNGGKLVVYLSGRFYFAFLQGAKHPGADLRKGSRRGMNRSAYAEGVAGVEGEDGAGKYSYGRG